MSSLIARNLSAISAISTFLEPPSCARVDLLESLKLTAVSILEKQNVELERKLDAGEPIDEADFPEPEEFQVLFIMYTNDQNSYRLFTHALRSENPHLVKLLFDVTEATLETGELTPGMFRAQRDLIHAVDTGSVEVVNQFLRYPYFTKDDLIIGEAIWVARSHPSLLALLLPLSAPLHSTHYSYYSQYLLDSLEFACKNGHTESVKLFIMYHSSADIFNGYHMITAVENGHMEIAKMIVACLDQEKLPHIHSHINSEIGMLLLMKEEGPVLTNLKEASEYLGSIIGDPGYL